VNNTNLTAREPLSLADNTSTTKAITAKSRPAEERSSRVTKPTEKKTESRSETKLAVPTLSGGIMSRLDSVASTAANSNSRVADMFTPAPAAINTRRFEDDQSGVPSRARLIGDLPTPRVPSQVADVEGEVRVRFNVDADGRPVMSSFSVVNSPNPLLTAAVRKVIPDMRFEPARTAGPDAKAISDVVQVGFQFSRRE
jgi:TonB family protein